MAEEAQVTSHKNESPTIVPVQTDSESMSAAQEHADGEAQARRNKLRFHEPPTSLQDHLASKRWLYVTDLVGPTWCEYAYQYNVMGMTHLDIEDRPESIKLPSGQEIRPNAESTAKRDKILKAGTEVHEKFETQVHPDKIEIKVATAEDGWAVRLLKLVVGLRSLIDDGCVRELPVFGWAENYLMTGIIDQIEKRPLPEATRAEAMTAHNSQQHRQVQDGQTKLPFPELSPITTPKKKKWASQEEWKADQRKSQRVKKSAADSKAKSKSPKKAKGRAPDVPSDPQQKDLKGFFGVSDKSSEGGQITAHPPSTHNNDAPEAEAAESVPAASLAEVKGIFLSDTKTRMVDRVPRTPDQRGARLQTMLYKRMFDGLCQGAVKRAAAAAAQENDGTAKEVSSLRNPPLAHKAIGIRGDPDAIPFDFATAFASLNLRSHESLSDSFLDGAREILDQLDLSNLPKDVAQNIRPSSREDVMDVDQKHGVTLSDLVHLVDQQLMELLIMAQRECSLPSTRASDEQIRQHIIDNHQHDASALQSELRLSYYQNLSKSIRLRSKSNSDPVPASSEGQQMIQQSLEGHAELFVSLDMEDGSGFQAAPTREGLRRSARVLAQTLLGGSSKDTAIDVDSRQTPPPTIDARTPSLPVKPFPSPSNSPRTRLIQHVDFPARSYALTEHIQSTLNFWHGQRKPVGVGEDEVWKCTSCPWIEGCEWRHEEGEKKRLQAAQKRKWRLTRDSISGTQEDRASDHASLWTPIQYDEQSQGRPQASCQQQDNYEELLWAQFDDDLPELAESVAQDTSHSVAPPPAPEQQDWIEMQADMAAARSHK